MKPAEVDYILVGVAVKILGHLFDTVFTPNASKQINTVPRNKTAWPSSASLLCFHCFYSEIQVNRRLKIFFIVVFKTEFSKNFVPFWNGKPPCWLLVSKLSREETNKNIIVSNYIVNYLDKMMIFQPLSSSWYILFLCFEIWTIHCILFFPTHLIIIYCYVITVKICPNLPCFYMLLSLT